MSRARTFNAILAAAIVAAGGAAYASVGPPAGPKTITTQSVVKRGSILSTVSATGNASAATQLNLNFGTSGIVSEIDVAPGQQVDQGQVLAKLDGRTQEATLASAQAGLASAQAKLSQDQGGATPAQVAQDQATLAQSQGSVNSAVTSVSNAEATAAQDATTAKDAVTQAQQAVTNAQSSAAQDAINLQTAVTNAETQLTLDNQQLSTDTNAYNADQSNVSSDQHAVDADCTTNPPSSQCSSDQQRLSQDQSKDSSDQAKVSADQQKVNYTDPQSITNARNAQATGLLKDQQAIASAQNAVTNAQNNVSASAIKDQQAITSAQNQLASAQAALQSAIAGNALKEQPALPATLAADEASVANAESQVNTAQTALQDTILTAPVGGTLATVNDRVGQSVSGNGTTPVTSSSSGSGSSSSSSGSSSGFGALTDLSSLQVVGGFSETDAAKVHLGQPATITFAALPSDQLQGAVSAIDTTSTVVSNVVTYNVTVSIMHAPATLKPGMTSTMVITTAEKDGVLVLPTSAVTARGSTATVQVAQPAPAKPITKTITLGTRGDTGIEVVSGLNAGDIVLTTITTSSSSRTATPTAARPGAGGIGGAAGGGFGGGAARAGG